MAAGWATPTFTTMTICRFSSRVARRPKCGADRTLVPKTSRSRIFTLRCSTRWGSNSSHSPIARARRGAVRAGVPWSMIVGAALRCGDATNWGRVAGLCSLVIGLAGKGLPARTRHTPSQRQRNAEVFGELLEAARTSTWRRWIGMTALHWAVYHDDSRPAARMLVRAGADVHAHNRYGVAPLSMACTNGNAALVKVLLEAGADPNTTLPGGETVLMTASHAGNLESCKRCSRGADPNSRERNEQTRRHVGRFRGHAAVVRTLSRRGRFPHTAQFRVHAVLFAVREGRNRGSAYTSRGRRRCERTDRASPQRSMAQQDTRLGVTLNSASFKPVRKGTSPLLMAVENGHFELAIALVEARGQSERRAVRIHPAACDELGAEAGCQRPGRSTPGRE